MRAAAGVGADQHPAVQPGRKLRQREPGRLDVHGRGVRARIAGPQHDGQCLLASVSTVISKGSQGMEPDLRSL